MTFWIKFFGVLAKSSSASPIILLLNSNTYFAYETATNYMVFYQNNKKAFIDKNFSKYIGTWIPISFSNYFALPINTYYPNMVTISVNRIDLQMESTYTVPASGITITQVSLGYEIVALFSEFSFYSRFIQGGYGQIMAIGTTRSVNLLFKILLSGNSVTNCISNSDLASGTTTSLQTSCVGDYISYLDTNIQCNNNANYFDPVLTSITPPCASCNTYCTTLCFYPGANQCTCDLSYGQYWLMRDTTTTQAYCSAVPNVDFSSYQSVTVNNINSSTTGESSLEFWVYVYSYNKVALQFEQISVIWDLHNRVTIVNSSNSLLVSCYSLVDLSNMSRYNEKQDLTMIPYNWNLVKCGTNLLTKKYSINNSPKDLQTTDIPVLPSTVQLKIDNPTISKTNFGFVFIRQLKLWQQYNFPLIETSSM